MNSIIAGWPQGLLIDASKGTPTDLNFSGFNPSLFVQNTMIAGCTTPVKYAPSATAPTGATDASILGWYNTIAYKNTILNDNSELALGHPFNYSTPDFNPTANSPAKSGASFTNPKLTNSFFTSVAYIGACAPGDAWWKTWTKFN
jgi:hypothetical protein